MRFNQLQNALLSAGYAQPNNLPKEEKPAPPPSDVRAELASHFLEESE